MTKFCFPLLIILFWQRIFCGLYLSPDLFYRFFKELSQTEAKSEEWGWLPGVQAGFDYEKSWQPYVGADLRFAEGQTHFDGTIQNQLLRTFLPFQSYTENTFLNVEGRLGYTLAASPLQFAPFLGIGFQSWLRKAFDRTTGYDEWYRWGYLALGCRFHWRYTLSWSGGLFFTLMRTKTSEVQIRGLYSWPIVLNLTDQWQAEASLPISWHHSSYSLSWITYMRYLPIGRSESQRTSRGEIFVPASTTYVIGNRLEWTVQF